MSPERDRRWWCELAWLGGEDATPAVLIEADEAGLIEDVIPGVPVPAAAEATRLAGLTVPGLVNAHSHAFHRALRGRTQVRGSFWTWREAMYDLAARLDPDRYLALATATFGEMALAGVTTVGEFHYLHHDAGGRPFGPGDPMGEAVVAAAAAAGVRLTLLDTCYLAGGVGRDLEPPQERFSDGDAGRWAARLEGLAAGLPAEGWPPVRVGAAVHSVRAVPPEAVAVVADWAARHDVPLHAHLSEQPAENEACVQAYGRTPTQVLADRGALGARFVAVHATHAGAGDVGLLGRAGASVCLCPTTERDLADGIGPAAALRAAGCGLCLGSDSHAVIDLLEEARAVELDERLRAGTRGIHAPGDLLAAATAGGAAALGWGNGGRLGPGGPADFTTLRTDSPALAGTLQPGGRGAAAAVVFGAGAAAVTDVVVAGRTVVAGGRHLLLGDVGRLLEQAVTQAWEG